MSASLKLKHLAEISPEVREALAAAALPELALRKAAERVLGNVFLSRVFRVEPGWEAEVIAQHASVRTVRSREELARAMGEATPEIILIMPECGYTQQQLMSALEAQAYTKTFLFVSVA